MPSRAHARQSESPATAADADAVDVLRLEQATRGLRSARPELSAATPAPLWQSGALAGGLLTLLVGLIIAPWAASMVLLAGLSLPFFCVVTLRGLALVLSRPEDHERGAPRARAVWPTYSILVPLYREAHVVPGLVGALTALDYPASALDILLVLEASDPETRAAVDAIRLPAHMRVVVVPDGLPRTKPKALNYALSLTEGEFVVVFDAEDRPEPDQLNRAVAAFERAVRSGERLACVQARLNIYNPSETWLTRQFTLEYTALFDCLLPTLQRLGLPLPLGGTSNHFPRRVLDVAGGWDPFNVTEDADLGIRLARMGWKVGVLGSTTWEEAPATFAVWKGQRTRWLKGWMQTFLVHLREPPRTMHELGPKGFLGLVVLMGGMLLSALVHPWFYVLFAHDLVTGTLTSAPADPAARLLWQLGLFNLVMGYVTGAALGAVAAVRRGAGGLAGHVLLMPFYWLLISYAAYRGLWQLAVAPFLWEKTEHRARGDSREPPDEQTVSSRLYDGA